MDIPEIVTLKKRLQEDNTDTSASSDITDLRRKAENAIRAHKRDVDYDTKEFTIELVVEKYAKGLETDENELFIPDYQREFVWSKKNQSRLIESLLIGLPIPYVFIADVESEDSEVDGRVEIVDGSQRIRTLHAFISNQLQLESLELIPELNGFTFSDLELSRQRRFNRISIRIIELSGCTEETRRDLFERINTGSDNLRDMEVRRGSKVGDSKLFKEVIAFCAKNSDFLHVVPLSEAKLKRHEDTELTLRFFAYLNNSDKFQHSVRDFLDEYMEENSNPDNNTVAEMNNIFEKTMRYAKENFPIGFRKSANAKTTPRVRFEALAIGIALALQENPDLPPQKSTSWLTDPKSAFKDLTTSDGSNSKPRVQARINFVKNALLAGAEG